MTYGDKVLEVMGGRGTPRKGPVGPAAPVEGVVKAYSAALGVSFTVPDWDGGTHVFGPAPWHRGAAAPTDADGGGTEGPHVHAAAAPVPGQRCLVVFVGSGIERPWVVAWY